MNLRHGLFLAAAFLLACALTSVGVDAQDAYAVRVQQSVQQMMLNEVGGQSPTVSFDRRTDRNQISNWEVSVRGSGTYRRFVNDGGTPFTYEGMVDTRNGRVYNCRYSLGNQWNGGNGGSNAGGDAVRYVQSSVRQQIRQQSSSDVRFNSDVRSSDAGSRQVRIDGTGVMWGRNGRERQFTYSGIYSERNRRVRDVQIMASGGGSDRPDRTEPDRVVDSNKVNQTYECFNNAFVLNGNNCNLTITGRAREVRINGSHNKIRIEGRTAAVVTPGNDNLVRWSSQSNPSAPQILNTGKANDIGNY